MTLQEIVRLFRQEVDDAVEPYLCADDVAIEYANDAEGEACRRARLIVDSSTPAVCRVNVAAGERRVPLVPNILFVRRARIAGRLPLARRTVRDMDGEQPYWEDAQPGTPRVYLTDAETGALLLSPAPDTDVEVQLTVVRTPLVEMDDLDDTPEIAPRFHRSLRFWMMFRHYSVQDSEANDPKKAADSLALFEQEFGKKSSAIDETWIEHEQLDMDGTF